MRSLAFATFVLAVGVEAPASGSPAQAVVMADPRQTTPSLVPGEDYDFFLLSEMSRLTTPPQDGDGSPKEAQDPLDGRIRVQAGTFFTDPRGGGPARDLGADGVRFTLLHWARPTLAYEFWFGTGAFASAEMDALVGARYYAPVRSRLRPYLGAGLGRLEVGLPSSGGMYDTHGVLGAELKLGVDVLLGRSFSVGVDARGAFARGGHRRFTPTAALGWAFGGRSRTQGSARK